MTTTLTRPQQPPAPALDLEALAALEPDAQWVLVFQPLYLVPTWSRWLATEQWALQTITDYNAGEPPRDGWSSDGPRDAPVTQLQAWAGGMLRRPVTLESDVMQIKLILPWSRWHAEPIYWVSPNT